MNTEITNRILAEVRHCLRDAWDLRLSEADRELVRRCCADAAELQLRALAAPRTPEAQLALLREKAHVQAQLANVTALVAAEVSEAFWDAVRTVINGAVAVAFAAV